MTQVPLTRWYLKRATMRGMVWLVVEELAPPHRGRCAYVWDRRAAIMLIPHLRNHLLAEIDPRRVLDTPRQFSAFEEAPNG